MPPNSEGTSKRTAVTVTSLALVMFDKHRFNPVQPPSKPPPLITLLLLLSKSFKLVISNTNGAYLFK